jgi:hypothetical protein
LPNDAAEDSIDWDRSASAPAPQLPDRAESAVSRGCCNRHGDAWYDRLEAVSFVQRFGGALNSDLHVQCLRHRPPSRCEVGCALSGTADRLHGDPTGGRAGGYRRRDLDQRIDVELRGHTVEPHRFDYVLNSNKLLCVLAVEPLAASFAETQQLRTDTNIAPNRKQPVTAAL